MWRSREQVRKFADGLKGKKFSELNLNVEDSNNKGNIGNLVEKYIFILTSGNKAAPDFENLGMELKVVPLTQKVDGSWRAKERISLSMINYESIIDELYESSSFIKKNKYLQIIWYHHDDLKHRSNWKIIDSRQIDIDEEFGNQPRKDWESIKKKIVDGYAHLLSEGDTEVIGAVTKSSKAENVRKQPNTIYKKLAKKRAFSLKQKYVTKIFENIAAVKEKPNIQTIILSNLEKYLNRDLRNEHNKWLKSGGTLNKNSSEKFVKWLINYNEFKSELSEKSIFVKVRRAENGKAKQHCRIVKISSDAVFQESFENSFIKSYLEGSKIINILYDYDNKKIVSYNIKKFDDEQMAKLEYDWNLICSRIKKIEVNKKVLADGKYKYMSNIPKPKETNIIHIRPGADNNKDTMTINGKEITKQAFWINKNWLE